MKAAPAGEVRENKLGGGCFGDVDGVVTDGQEKAFEKGSTSMPNFNKVIIAGNLTRDPELKFTSGGIPVCDFGIAVNRVRSKTDEVDFFDVSAWRELGETIANYKKKGDPILVEGRLQYRSWEADDGSRRSKVDVIAENVQFLVRHEIAA